jgi:hypothetical protein
MVTAALQSMLSNGARNCPKVEYVQLPAPTPLLRLGVHSFGAMEHLRGTDTDR